MFWKLTKIGGFVLLIVFVLVTLAFTSVKYNNATCQNIEIDYDSEELIHVDKDEIVRLVTSADKKVIGKKFDQINAELLEGAVEKHDAILKAEVYKIVAATDSLSYKGVLKVKIKHRDPVVRIISGTGSYYLDEFGGKIPVSSKYTANVLVSTGTYDEKYAKEKLLPCVLFMQQDEFWNAQIEQVHVEKSGDVILTPLVGDHFIELGKLDNYEEKLRNMKAFYKQVLASNNWNKYESISLKYKNQVIAKRR
uniref:cell division protein FtsQ/DivIB n=1 Tax=uncultured Draconibacterium sp. TaxID=1573823 RepID=UPI0032178255